MPSQQVPDPGMARAEQALIDNPTLARIMAEATGTPVRQGLMKRLHEKTGRYVISYIALISALGNDITFDDIAPFHSILSTVPVGEPLDLLINSPGGIPVSAEKMVTLIRQRNHPFRAVVTNYAKSAATLICLGADRIAMGDVSELGPTDPQMTRIKQGGVIETLPAHAYLDAHKEIVDRINQAGASKVAVQAADILQLQQLDPAFLRSCRQAVDASRVLAEQWLARYMLKQRVDPVGEAKRIATDLAESREYLSHARMIDYQRARDVLGLEIDYLGPDDETWQLFWELYCRSELFLRQAQQTKLFESTTASMTIAVRAMPTPA